MSVKMIFVSIVCIACTLSLSLSLYLSGIASTGQTETQWKELAIQDKQLQALKTAQDLDRTDPVSVAHAYTIPAEHAHPEDMPTLDEYLIRQQIIHSHLYQVTLHYPGGDKAGDSIHAWKHRILLERKSGEWVPVAHGKLWKGRGHPGWTTEPCL